MTHLIPLNEELRMVAFSTKGSGICLRNSISAQSSCTLGNVGFMFTSHIRMGVMGLYSTSMALRFRQCTTMR